MLNYFHLLGLPIAFDLNPSQLEKKYFELQRQYHPDRVAHKPAEERQVLLQQSMSINEAYQALKSPLKRAQHLLKLQGIAVNTEKDSIKPSQELLLENMEWREKLQEADDRCDIVSLEEKAEAQRHETLSSLSQAFAADKYDRAAQLALRLRYLEKFLEESHLIKQKKYEPAANS